MTGVNLISEEGSGQLSLAGLSDGIYFISVRSGNIKKTVKILHDSNSWRYTVTNLIKSVSETIHTADSITISATGYYEQKYPLATNYSEYVLLPVLPEKTDFFTFLPRTEAFELLQSNPLSQTFGEVKSVKVVYSIPDKKMYYANSKKFQIHYYFARDVLGYSKSHSTFNLEQYQMNSNRIYYLASLNYFKASGIYTLEFFPGDEINCEEIKLVYDKIAKTSYIGNNLRLYTGAMKWSTCPDVNGISSDELYAGQNYQPLNARENFGYLKMVDVEDLDDVYLGRHDIVLLNGIPNDIPVVAGIITTEFQTPLSHINVLSHNRGTPNMALRDALTNHSVSDLTDKLVYLKVSPDTFILREASLPEAGILVSE
ncbi:MAG: hypothetical protein HC906_00475 [Bacteroidales bacterium]|nr:hypothetical protein [Bacteroidales bacterium]